MRTLQWRHNERNDVLNHQHMNCLLSRWFRHQRKCQSSALLAFMKEIHQSPVDSPHKGSVMRKIIPFHDVIITWLKRLTRVVTVSTRNRSLRQPICVTDKIYPAKWKTDNKVQFLKTMAFWVYTVGLSSWNDESNIVMHTVLHCITITVDYRGESPLWRHDTGKFCALLVLCKCTDHWWILLTWSQWCGVWWFLCCQSEQIVG